MRAWSNWVAGSVAVVPVPNKPATFCNWSACSLRLTKSAGGALWSADFTAV